MSGLTICPNSLIYFLKKPTASKNPLSLKIMVGFSNTSMMITLPRLEIILSAKI